MASLTKIQRLVIAYARLQVSPNEVAAAPKATPFLSTLPGGIPFAIDVLRGSSLPEARKFMSRYDDICLSRADRNLLPFEAFCVAADVCPSRMREIVVVAVARQQSLEGTVISAMGHTDVIRTNLEMAKSPLGLEDRIAHFKMMGALPIPKSSQTSVTVNASASASSVADSKSLSVAAAPSPEDTIRRIIESRQQRQQLAAQQSQSQLPAATETGTVPMFMPNQVRQPSLIDADRMEAEE